MAENTSTVVSIGTGIEFWNLWGGPMSFMLYVIGFVIFTAGVAWAMSTIGVSSLWVGITCVILLGLGILTGASKTRSKDPPSPA